MVRLRFDDPLASLSLREQTLYLFHQRKITGCSQQFHDRLRSKRSWSRRLHCAHVLKAHRGCVNTISWDATGDLLFSGSDDREVCVWELLSHGATLLHKLPTNHHHNIFGAELRPFRRDCVVTTSADGRVGLTHMPPALPEPEILYDTSQAMSTKLSFQPGSANVFVAALSDRGSHFMGGSDEDVNGVRLFDLRDRQTSRLAFPCEEGAVAVGFSPMEEHLFACGVDDTVLRIGDLRMLRRDSEGHSIPSAAFSLGEVYRRRGLGISGLDWSADGRRVLVNYRGNGPVAMFRVGTAPSTEGVELNRCERTFEGRVNEQTMAKEVVFLHGETAVATGGDCGSLFIWDVQSSQLVRRTPADKCIVNCVAPHPHLPLVATSGIDDTVKLWDIGDEWEGTDTQPAHGSKDRDWARRMREAPPTVTPEDAAERIEKAEGHKGEGNTLVRQQEFGEAVDKYRAALQELHFVPPSAGVRQQRKTLQCACWLNQAHCMLQLAKNREAIELCTLVLNEDDTSVKAYYRRANALLGTGDFAGALDDARAALAIDPSNGEIQRLKERIIARRHQYRQQQLEFLAAEW
eukprot:Hpha_TRINITY_DN35264_c0_g1::TRINITY_DN35264_c0_g1_i2::g.145163::m.145163/K11804/WDR42A; WD repeat-containing protein 42A